MIIQFALLVAFLACFGFLAKQFNEYAPRDPLDQSISILDSTAVLLSIILSVWFAGRFVDRRRFSDFGFRLSQSWWIDLIIGLALGALLQTGIFVIEIATGMADISEVFWSRIDSHTFLTSVVIILFSLATRIAASKIVLMKLVISLEGLYEAIVTP